MTNAERQAQHRLARKSKADRWDAVIEAEASRAGPVWEDVLRAVGVMLGLQGNADPVAAEMCAGVALKGLICAFDPPPAKPADWAATREDIELGTAFALGHHGVKARDR